MRPGDFRHFAAGAAFAVLLSGPASADSALDASGNLFGDLGGFRTAFAKVGGTLSVTETGEVFANPYGGLQRGAAFDGLTTIAVKVNTKDAFGWDGGTFYASLIELHGENFTPRNIGALQTISGASGDRALRLWELWYEQKLGDQLDVRFGQQSLDFEFAGTPSDAFFVNSLFGWPALHALDMPDGGPAFPLSALGLRARFQSGPWTALAGVYSGESAPTTNPDPQQANRYGLSFPVRGALAIAEAQYAAGLGEGAYAGVYKLGAWYDNLPFADLRYNAFGQPLADPTAAATPRLYRGNFGLYAVADQTIWRGAEKERVLNLFVRPQFAPQSDRNLAVFALNAGLSLKDPLPGRKNDSFGLGFGYVQLSPAATGASLDAALFNPAAFTPRRSYEAVFEATYLYQATAWAQIQPDLQYVRNPGGGIADPAQPGRKVRDAVIGGLRVIVTF